MNKLKTIVTDDPFRAAYLMLYGRYKETTAQDGEQRYARRGSGLRLCVFAFLKEKGSKLEL